MKSLCVFCGSSLGTDPLFRDAACCLGELLAERNIQLVYGGADVGLMGCVANACLTKGGTVIGVMPEYLIDMEVAHSHLTDLKIVSTMHERKAMMSDLSDGFISLPGGIGTIEETFEMFTWLQLGLQIKPLGLLNVSGFYDYLKQFLESMVKKGFLLEEHLEMLLIMPEVESLLDKLLYYKPKKLEKWFDKEKNRV